MAMTQRERFLAIGVGVTIGLFGLQYGFNKLRSNLAEKEDRVDAALSELEGMERLSNSGKLAVRKLEELQTKSLPTNREALVAQYKDWMFELAEQAGLKEVKVVSLDRPSKTTQAYSAYDFKLSGTCRTDQVIDLLGYYYDKSYLHTITSLKITPTKERNVVTLVLDSQALALASASPKQEPSAEPSGRLAMSLADYKEKILNRNPFSPPNNAPQITTGSSHSINRGEQWTLQLESKDSEGHRVNFEVVSDELPEGLRVRDGVLSWRPSENGVHELLVRATDDGWPQRSTEQRIKLAVVDPPPVEVKVETPTFDVASQAFVSAILSGKSGPEAWIRSRTDGNTLYLSKGADFELGSIKAKVVDINLNEDFVEFETDGARWTIGMDDSLADAYKKSQVD